MKAQHEKNTAELKATESELVAVAGRVAELEKKRTPLVPLARVKKDAKAQAQITTIDTELLPARNDVTDLCAETARLRSELATLSQSIEEAEWERDREQVIEALRPRLDGKIEKRLEKAVDELLNIFREMQEANDALAIRVRSFVRRGDVIGNKRMGFEDGGRLLAERYRDLVSYRLNSICPSPLSTQWMNVLASFEFSKQGPAILGDLIGKLSALQRKQRECSEAAAD